MAVPKALQTYLKKNKLVYEPVAHKTVFTAYDVAQTLHVKLGDVVKTLVVRADGKLLLAVLPADRRLDLAKARKAAKAKTLALVSEKAMEKSLGIRAGAVTAFGGFHKLPMLCDASLKAKVRPLFGAGSFTDSIRLAPSRFLAVEKPMVAPICEAKKAVEKSAAKRKKRSRT